MPRFFTPKAPDSPQAPAPAPAPAPVGGAAAEPAEREVASPTQTKEAHLPDFERGEEGTGPEPVAELERNNAVEDIEPAPALQDGEEPVTLAFKPPRPPGVSPSASAPPRPPLTKALSAWI